MSANVSVVLEDMMFPGDHTRDVAGRWRVMTVDPGLLITRSQG